MRQELKCKPCRYVGLAPQGLLSLLSYTPQDCLPRDGTTNCGQSPSTSITNLKKKMPFRLADRLICLRPFSQLRFCLPRRLELTENQLTYPLRGRGLSPLIVSTASLQGIQRNLKDPRVSGKAQPSVFTTDPYSKYKTLCILGFSNSSSQQSSRAN